MNEELSGMKLRIATCKASGVEPTIERDHDLEREIWPPCESVVAVAWTLMESWRLADPEHRAIETNCHFVESTTYPMDRIYWMVVLSEFDEDTDEETEWQGASETDLHQDSTHALSEAICRALVAAAQVKDVEP